MLASPTSKFAAIRAAAIVRSHRKTKNTRYLRCAFRARDSMAPRSLLCIAARQPESTLDAARAIGWAVHPAPNLKSGHRLLEEHGMLVGLVVPVPGQEDFDELDDFLRAHDGPEWVGAFDSRMLAVPSCRDLIVNRLFDHHTHPLEPARLLQTLGHAFGHAALRHGEHRQDAPAERAIIGQTEAMRDLQRQLRRASRVDAPVLLRGESGCGKELAAQEIHRQSSRSAGPLVAVNCGAIHPSLIQSELFGHTKGAFTGAARDERGLIESANTGTIFFDEIGDLPLDMQTNLLRFLENKAITRLGSTRSIEVDVRVIAATHVDLEQAIAKGSFREDLYYRLNVLPIEVPPLRARKADIEALATHVFAKFDNEKSPQVRGFSHRARLAMAEHDWPGNVRELVNRVRRAMVMAEGRLISPADLGLGHDAEGPHTWDGLDDARRHAERNAIFQTLEHAGANVTEAARKLGVSRMTLYRLMAKHGIAH